MKPYKCPWCGRETDHRRGCPGAAFLWSEVYECPSRDFGERDQ